MDNLGDLLVLAFVAWSVLGGLLGRRKSRPAPPARRRPVPPPTPRREDRGMQVEDDVAPATLDPRASDPAAEIPASILVPDDLWEILTGERRSYDDAIDREPRSREVAPRVVSLEDPPPPAPIRHAAFHHRLQSLESDRPRGGRDAASSAARRRLRRAIVLREVLGPPRGLEDGGPIR